jgi:hypothetical protein
MPHEPTATTRATVSALTGSGHSQKSIAGILGIDLKTLRKHYREELNEGGDAANARVAMTLFRMATTGENVAATIYWLKCRGRGQWREQKTDPTETREVREFIVREDEEAGPAAG